MLGTNHIIRLSDSKVGYSVAAYSLAASAHLKRILYLDLMTFFFSFPSYARCLFSIISLGLGGRRDSMFFLCCDA